MTKRAAQTQPNRLDWLARALWLLALAGGLYLVGLTLWLALAGLAFPYQLDYGEGFLLHFVDAWSQGQPIYKAAEGYPYILSNYPPLHILLALALTPLLGLSYAAGRIWTLLAVAAATGLVVAWVWRWSRGWLGQRFAAWLPALAAGLLFAGSPYVYHWAPLFRIDLLGLALTLGGLYTVNLLPRAVGARRRRLFWLAVLLFVAGLYTKQSFLFAPLAGLAYLFFFVSRRQALALGAAVGGLGGGLFLLINALTGGAFWYSLVESNVNPFLWPEFGRQLASFFGTFAPLVLLAGWHVADKFILERDVPLGAKVDALDLYLPVALASIWLAGKAGAWENYFFEALAALSIAAGLGLARLLRQRASLPRLAAPALRLAAPVLVLLQVALMWHTPRVAQRYLALTRQSNEVMIPILAATPDPIVSEDMGLLVTNDKTLDYCSFQYSQLARAGRYDQAWELGQLRQRAFSLVILEEGTRLDVDHYQRFTRAFLSELDRNYRHSRTVGKYEIYEPAPLQHQAPAAFGDQLALVGWSLHPPPGKAWPDLAPGDTVGLEVIWQAQQALATDYVAFAHLVDGDGQGWAGDDHSPHGGLYPTTAWGAGEMVRDTFTLTLPADAPPGLYDVQVGWYDPATETRLPAPGGSSQRLAVLPVAWQGTSPEPLAPLDASFGPATLAGYHWQIDGDTLEVTLRWSAGGPLDADYTVFLHLVEPGGSQALSQGDGPPLGGRWPTSLWLPGLVLDDVHRLPLPPGLPPGPYDLLVGLYDPATGQRLPLPDGRDALRLKNIPLP